MALRALANQERPSIWSFCLSRASGLSSCLSFRSSLPILLSCFLASLALACDKDNPGKPAEPQWTSLGFENCWVLELELSLPYLYACAGYEGLFRLDLSESGADWQYVGLADTSLTDEPFEHSTWMGVQDVAVLDSGVILAGLFSGRDDVYGVYRSSDRGTTWVPSDVDPDMQSSYPPGVFSLESSSCDPNVVLAGTEGAIYRSEDSGSTWELVYGSPYAGLGWKDIRIHPADCNIAWAGGETNRLQERLAKSTDHGLTWENVDLRDEVPHDNAVFRLAAHPTDPAVLYLGMFWGVLKTADGGSSWGFTIFLEPRMVSFRGLAIDEADPNHIYVSQDNLVFESWDGGETSTLMDIAMRASVTDLLYDSEAQVLYVATLGGTYRYGRP